MDLKFTPRTISEIENQTKKPITEVMGVFSMNYITLFVKKGLQLKEDVQAHAVIEQYLQNGGELTTLYIDILESLQKDGFLPKALNLDQIRAKMQNMGKNEDSEEDISQING